MIMARAAVLELFSLNKNENLRFTEGLGIWGGDTGLTLSLPPLPLP